MKKIIDLQAFQKITTDCMRVHEAYRNTELLTTETEGILQLADSLLREAGLSYLDRGQNLDVPSLPNSEQATPPEQVVESFIRVQHALVDLKQALYQLVKTCVAEQRWPELAASTNTLIYLGENPSAFPSIVSSVVEDTFIPQAEHLFKSGEWDKGRTLLKSWLFSPKVRSCYYASYVDQAYASKSRHPLIELKRQLPAERSSYKLPAYRLNVAAERDDICELESFLSDTRDEVKEIVMAHDFNPTPLFGVITLQDK